MLKDLWLIIEFTPDKENPPFSEVMLTDILTIVFSTVYWLGVAGLLTWVVNFAG